LMQRRRLDFPDALGPITAVIFFAGTLKLTASSACRCAYQSDSDRSSSAIPTFAGKPFGGSEGDGFSGVVISMMPGSALKRTIALAQAVAQHDRGEIQRNRDADQQQRARIRARHAA